MSKYCVKNVKNFMGMDCPGYNCSLYKDGKKIADIINDGSGGETMMDFTSRAEEKEFSDFAESKPPLDCGDGIVLDMDAALYIDQLLEEHDRAKKCKKHTIFKDPKTGQWYSMKRPFNQAVRDWLVFKYGKDVEILNERVAS